LLPRYCHRIIDINNNLFTAKGDNREKSDKYEIDVPIENIEGKIETYLVDIETKQYKKIGPGMVKEHNSKLDKTLDLIEKIYNLFFND